MTKAIIIGAGHNGLACAAYLAKGGMDVTVLEAADHVGGAAVTREFATGYRVSAGAHLLYALDETIRRDLALDRYGLRMAAEGLLATHPGIQETAREAGVSPAALIEALETALADAFGRAPLRAPVRALFVHATS